MGPVWCTRSLEAHSTDEEHVERQCVPQSWYTADFMQGRRWLLKWRFKKRNVKQPNRQRNCQLTKKIIVPWLRVFGSWPLRFVVVTMRDIYAVTCNYYDGGDFALYQKHNRNVVILRIIRFGCKNYSNEAHTQRIVARGGSGDPPTGTRLGAGGRSRAKKKPPKIVPKHRIHRL